jgi:hypothetical protein
MAEARKLAVAEGVALSQLINVEVAEKVSTLRTAEYFRERAGRTDRRETLRILARAGRPIRPRKAMSFPRVGKQKAKAGKLRRGLAPWGRKAGTKPAASGTLIPNSAAFRDGGARTSSNLVEILA